jgi:ribonuclease HII
MPVSGRKWSKVDADTGEKVRVALVARGGVDVTAGLAQHEVWRVRFPFGAAARYANGSIYLTGGPDASAALDVRGVITEIAGPPFTATDRSFLIGFDESGKSEIAGAAILAGVVVPVSLSDEAEEFVATAKTKSSHAPTYFAEIATNLQKLASRGLEVVVEHISPTQLDAYKVTGLFDVTYARMAKDILRRVAPSEARIAADDYGIRGPFARVLEEARSHGADVFAQPKADDEFLESRVASLIARYERELVVGKMNSDECRIGELQIGTGHWGDAMTQAWLHAWKASGRPWPAFIRRSSAPVCELDARRKPKKTYPPGWDADPDEAQH